MKKIIFFIILLFAVSSVYSADKKNLSDFITDAESVAREMEEVKQKLSDEKAKYETKIKKIECLKNKKNDFFLFNFINEVILKYYLGGANASAFKISNLTRKQRELNNDYFTLVSLITTEYGEKIRGCIKNKCPDLKDLYNSRIKWLDIIKNYESYIGVDLAFDIFERQYDEKSKKDLIEYLDKKIVQIDQRIYILNEEKITSDMIKNSKIISVKNEKVEFDKKISELQKLKYVIQEKIKEIEKTEIE